MILGIKPKKWHAMEGQIDNMTRPKSMGNTQLVWSRSEERKHYISNFNSVGKILQSCKL